MTGDRALAGSLELQLAMPWETPLFGEPVRVDPLVYAFYDPNFSFREVIKKHPEAGGLITDCLSGDVNKDFTQLWDWIREFVPLPDDLPYGEPLAETTEAVQA